VSEQQDVTSDLEEAGVLGGVRWAYRSACTRTLEIYSEADGHDAAWFGNTRFTLFRDRLDRVFGCGRYAVQPGGVAGGGVSGGNVAGGSVAGGSVAGGSNLDVLYAELSEHDRRTMPQLAPGLVRRADFNGSPGWAQGDRRFLLAAGAFGKLDRLPWPQKSPTKRRVALQLIPEPPQASLFDVLADEELAGLIALRTQARTLDLETFVIAHTLDSLSGAMELIFGRARLNSGGGDAWFWQEDLLSAPPADGRRSFGASPEPSRPDLAPDAPVRLRRETRADRGQVDRGQADQGQADRGQADRGQADRGQADRDQADRDQAGGDR
jgi:hypothetical protein